MSDGLTRTELSLWRDLWPFVRRDLGTYALALLLAPATATMVVLQPWLLKHALDTHVVPRDADGLARTVGAYGAVVVLGFALQTVHTLALSTAAMRTITHVRTAVVRHLLGRSQRFLDQQPTGKLLTRATSDVEALGETLSAGAITIVLDVLQVVAVVGAMLWLDARLVLVLGVVGPVVGVVVEVLRRRLKVLYVEVRGTLADLNAWLAERLEGIEVVQLYRDEARAVRGFTERLDRYTDATVRTNLYDALLYAAIDGIGAITMALLLGYGAGFPAEVGLTAGTLAAFLDYTARLFRPIQEFSAKVSVIQRASASLRKIFGLLDVEDRVPAGTTGLPAVRGDVRFEGVSFAYGADDVLHDVSIAAAPGETVALVGRTGSGKTTLTRLLFRAYDGFRGRITLDGVSVADLDDATLHRAIGVVLQDVQLFPGDVRFNLTLGLDVDDARLAAAVHRARADGVVARLGGLDGHVEEGGRNLSSGEAQLLAFARVLLRDPAVVVLDEATASVDSLTEAALQAATREVLVGRTTWVVAHRLSTITHADRIVVLDHGRVVESGRHEELLARGGAYAELFAAQFVPAPVT